MLLLAFLAIGLLILVLGVAMAAYQRRTIEQHREQVHEILAEMKRIAEEEGDAGAEGPGSES
jgi:hypothetical protein